MGVLPIITLMLVEVLAAAVSIGAFLYLLRAPVRPNRRTATVLYASSFLLVSLASLTLFFGQFFQIYSIKFFPASLLYWQFAFLPVSSALVIMATARVYGVRWRWAFDAVAILAGAAAVVATWLLPNGLVEISGLFFPDISVPAALPIFFPSILGSVVLVGITGLLSMRQELTVADRFMRAAGVIALLFFITAIVAIDSGSGWLILLTIALVPVDQMVLYLGATAKVNADVSLEEKPWHLIDRRVAAKAIFMNIALFSVLTIVVTVVTSSYFVNVLDQARTSSRKRDLNYITRSYSSYSIALLEETIRLASYPSLQTVSKGKTGVALDVTSQVTLRGRARIYRVLDRRGRVVFSNYSDDEIGRDLSQSAVVQKALKGNHVAAAELDSGINRWVIRAAAPIGAADGDSGLVLLGTDIADAFDFGDYGDINASGYGFFSVRGEAVYGVGDGVDGVTRVAFEKAVRGISVVSGETDDGLHFSVQRVFATDGTPDGFFYIFTSHRVLEREVARILIVVTVIMLLSITIIAAILMFSLSFILKPIRRLALAAARLEEGQYDVTFPIDSNDEVGSLARAMESMSKTIGERTRNLEAALRTQRDFMAHTALEMRTPLNIFRWTLELMRLGDLGRLNKEQMELLEQMNQTNQRLLDMVENLRIASRLDENRLILSRDGVVIEDVIEEVAGELSVKLREKGQALHWNRPEPPLPPAFADRQRLYQIVLNLMSNAVKYTKKNGHIEATVDRVGTSGPGRNMMGDFLKITIEDSGIGIPKEEQSRVFSRFFRSKDILQTEIEGTGLGLYIAKQLVDLHGGEIWFESTEGVGSAFHFTIPVKKKYDSAERESVNP